MGLVRVIDHELKTEIFSLWHQWKCTELSDLEQLGGNSSMYILYALIRLGVHQCRTHVDIFIFFSHF